MEEDGGPFSYHRVMLGFIHHYTFIIYLFIYLMQHNTVLFAPSRCKKVNNQKSMCSVLNFLHPKDASIPLFCTTVDYFVA